LRRLAVNLGMTFGPAAGGFLALYSYTWLFAVEGATCLFAAAAMHRMLPDEPVPEPEAPQGFLRPGLRGMTGRSWSFWVCWA
jgi:MFS family permease